MFHRSSPLALLVLSCCVATVQAEKPPQSPKEWITHFSEGWDKTAWQEKHPRFPDGYMRALEDSGWKIRMQAMQACVRQGKISVSPLLESLQHGDVPMRIFAAQALGYLGSGVPVDPLVDALGKETDPAVRLYLIDSLGMLGQGQSVDWEGYLKKEANPDVKRHVGYVQERGSRPVDPQVVETLTNWDFANIDSAAVGKPAPHFALLSTQGETVRLDDYSGKTAVVLVFLYGDT